jgi:alkanesulfonate monooxygenase SsuD/methylene tetrahydromethanopterin reductase-like flavin-dependent oxidoreductase (luciferase family)
MKMGVSLFANNSDDNERFLALENGEGEPVGDGVDNYTWASDIEFGDMIEPLGFDSIWTVEHHFSPYTLVPNPVQFLSFWAGRTKRVDVGTMVVVLPWHNPVRLAEEIVMLEHMLGDDRNVFMGFGRGIGRREFGGLNIPLTETRERFEENFRIVRGLIENERFAYKGEYTTVPDGVQRESQDISLRPRPRNSQKLIDNFYAAFSSPESMRATGHLGMKPLIIPARSYEDIGPELVELNEIRATLDLPAVNPTVGLYLYCGETEAELEMGRRHMLLQAQSAFMNYEFGNELLKTIPNYAHYNSDSFREGMLERRQANASAGFVGTPDTLIRLINETVDLLHPDQLWGVFKQGGMPLGPAQKSMELFAKEVLPAVHEMVPKSPLVHANVS